MIPSGLSPKTTEFEFTVTLKKADGTTLAGSYNYSIGETTGTIASGGTVTLSDGQTVTITGLPAGATYEVTEAAVSGFTTEKTGDTGTIVKNETAEASFTNTYSVTPVSVDPPVKKDITDNGGLDNLDLYNRGDFTFTIENTQAPEGVTPPMPDYSSINNSAAFEVHKAGYYEFGEIVFRVPGTYTYTVTESGSALGVTNDAEATKSITFTVTDDGEGHLTVTPGTDSAVFYFTNVYKTGELDITKTVVNSINNNDTTKFTFTVTFTDASGNAVEGSFPYRIGETTGSIASGGTLQLGNG